MIDNGLIHLLSCEFEVIKTSFKRAGKIQSLSICFIYYKIRLILPFFTFIKEVAVNWCREKRRKHWVKTLPRFS